jgi:hypothetical protein
MYFVRMVVQLDLLEFFKLSSLLAACFAFRVSLFERQQISKKPARVVQGSKAEYYFRFEAQTFEEWLNIIPI